jgi:hypothetical protein
MVEGTLDDNASYLVADNFTIAFWARAREPLSFTQVPVLLNASVAMPPRGAVFSPVLPSSDTSAAGLGFYLGTDGYTVVLATTNSSSAPVVQRQSLVGWHHYAIVCDSLQPTVYIDGSNQSSELSVANNLVQHVGFRPVFGRTRAQYLSASYGVGFEGWISQVRIASRVMHGGEALAQTNNGSAWDYAYSASGCSGENHAGTDVEQFMLQQAWLVCAEALPTCGVGGGGFQIGDSLGQNKFSPLFSFFMT